MDICDVVNKYNEDKLYNIVDVKEKFKDYFGVTLEELEFYFSTYNIVDKNEVINYLKMESKGYLQIEEIIENRMLEYEYYDKVLKILSRKALNYLMIIKYLCNCKERNEYQEKILEEVQIYHYSSIVTGSDINRLLIVLFHLLKKFNSTLETANNKQDYLTQRISSGSLRYEKDELYPSEKLIMKDEYYLDKTSLKMKRKAR